MKYEDLHPFARWLLRKDKHKLTPDFCRMLEEEWGGPLDQGQFPPKIAAAFLWSILIGESIVLLNLIPYVGGIAISICLGYEVYSLKRNIPR